VTEWLVAPGSGPFVVALLVMLGLALVEVVAVVSGIGLNDVIDEYVVPHSGIEALGDGGGGLDATTPADADGVIARFLAWLYVGRVPVLMMLVVFLGTFALIGLAGQAMLRGVMGWTLPALVAVPVVFAASLPFVRACGAALARWLPRDETTAVDPATFVGRTAEVTGGIARSDLPAQARVVDAFGTAHYVLVEPDVAGIQFATGTRVLLVRQIGGGRFAAIVNTNASLVDKDS
jgi:hypothetical protein